MSIFDLEKFKIPFDPGRRKVVKGLGAGVLGAALVACGVKPTEEPATSTPEQTPTINPNIEIPLGEKMYHFKRYPDFEYQQIDPSVDTNIVIHILPEKTGNNAFLKLRKESGEQGDMLHLNVSRLQELRNLGDMNRLRAFGEIRNGKTTFLAIDWNNVMTLDAYCRERYKEGVIVGINDRALEENERKMLTQTGNIAPRLNAFNDHMGANIPTVFIACEDEGNVFFHSQNS